MFGKKKDIPDPIAKKGIKKMDAVVTGALLGGIVASLYGVKKINDSRKEKTEEMHPDSESEEKKGGFFAKFVQREKSEKNEK